MTGPVLAFDINATRGGTLRRISSADAVPEVAVAPPFAPPVAVEDTSPPVIITARAEERAPHDFRKIAEALSSALD